MSYELMVILSYTIVPAAIAAAWRWRNADVSFYPMLFFLQLGLVNEILSSLLTANGYSNAVNYNIFY